MDPFVQFLFALENSWPLPKSSAAEAYGSAAGATARGARFVSMLLNEDMAMKKPDLSHPQTTSFGADLDALLHPALAFHHPRDVVGDADLTLNEKRAILASWASDACAIEAAPALRKAPGTDRAVSVDEILEALRALDREASEAAVAPSGVRRRRIDGLRSRRTGHPSP
jgi:hypothetical protein